MKLSKTPEARIGDAINYIKRLDPTLGFTIQQKTLGHIRTVGKDISLGLFAKRIAAKEVRSAIRGLLLCQRYYFSSLWADRAVLPLDWKQSSINYWSSRTKRDIDDAILLFTATTDTTASLAEVAERANIPPSGDFINYNKLNRLGAFDIGNGICYVAITAWLLKSGLVSYPWYMKSRSVTSPSNLEEKFGPPQRIWSTSREFTIANRFNVPRGYIVHMYVPGDAITMTKTVLIANSAGRAVWRPNSIIHFVNPIFQGNLPAQRWMPMTLC